MFELLDSGVLMRTIHEMTAEDLSQIEAIRVLTYGTNNISLLLTERLKPEVEKPEPHILILEEVDGEKKPVIYNRYTLVSFQKSQIERLQSGAKAFEEETGHAPADMSELEKWLKERMFTQANGHPPASDEELEKWFEENQRTAVPEDPLGGEYYIDQEGKIQVRNMKY